MFKRVFLFIVTNLLVLVTISIVLSVLHVQPYLTAYGLNYTSLMIFCAIWGFGGAFISLALSRVMAKWMMRVKIVDPQTRDTNERDLVAIIHRLAQAAHLPKMPDVGIYDSPEVNAFATGPTKSRALVAVSTGLLSRMGRAEIEGVLGHEITHIANGDMVTMTLVQGVINAFVMFFARIAAFAVSDAMRGNNDRRGGSSFMMQWLLITVFDIIFGILGSIVVCWFSRQREFRADKGGATLAGRDRMISALESLQRMHELTNSPRGEQAFATLKIAGEPRGIMGLFMTHPPLEKRIERLRQHV